MRLLSITVCHSASVYCSGCLRMLMPALLTRMSRRPCAFTVSVDQGAARILLQDVDRDGAGLGAGLLDLLHGRGILGGVAARHDDGGAGARHAQRHAKPDAAVAAGDHGDAAGKIEKLHVQVPPSGSVCIANRPATSSINGENSGYSLIAEDIGRGCAGGSSIPTAEFAVRRPG